MRDYLGMLLNGLMGSRRRLLVVAVPVLALVAAGAGVALSRGSDGARGGAWSRRARLFGHGRYTFAPKLAVSEDGQMIAAWYSGKRPSGCACGAERIPSSMRAAHSAPSHRKRRPSGTKVIVDPGMLPGGFGRPMVVSNDGTDGEDDLQVAVSGAHVAYVAFEAAHRGWRIIALRGKHLSRPVDLPHGAHGGSQLQALLSSRDGPVIAVWARSGAWEYARLHADGTLGRTVRIARTRGSDSEPRFAVNDNGALAAAWIQGSSRSHPASEAMVVRCSVMGACSAPMPVSLGAAEPESEEVALALSDDGRLSVLVAGHDRGIVQPPAHGVHAIYTSGANYGVWGASAAAGAKLAPLRRISPYGGAPVLAADGTSGAAAAFQLSEPPNLRLGFSLREGTASRFQPAELLRSSRSPQPAALVANLRGQLLAAWKQPTESSPIEVLQGQGTRLRVAHRLPASAHAAGATPAAGIDSRGDAIVLWDRWCKGARTCGMYASIFHASSSAKLLGTGTLTGAIRYVGGPAPAPGTRRQPSAGWVHVQTADGKRVRVIYVQAGHRFQLKLPAGRYRVYGTEARHNGLEPGCSAQQVRVRAGQATSARLAIGCLVA